MPVRLFAETGQQQPSEHPTPASERLAARTPDPNGIPNYWDSYVQTYGAQNATPPESFLLD
jgi:hypothetical protein